MNVKSARRGSCSQRCAPPPAPQSETRNMGARSAKPPGKKSWGCVRATAAITCSGGPGKSLPRGRPCRGKNETRGGRGLARTCSACRRDACGAEGLSAHAATRATRRAAWASATIPRLHLTAAARAARACAGAGRAAEGVGGRGKGGWEVGGRAARLWVRSARGGGLGLGGREEGLDDGGGEEARGGSRQEGRAREGADLRTFWGLGRASGVRRALPPTNKGAASPGPDMRGDRSAAAGAGARSRRPPAARLAGRPPRRRARGRGRWRGRAPGNGARGGRRRSRRAPPGGAGRPACGACSSSGWRFGAETGG